MFRVIYLGDIVGKVGRKAISSATPVLREKYEPDLVIANGENAAGGLGIDPGTANELFGYGVDLMTTGNHIWQRKQILGYLEENSHRLLRPVNFPAGAPGSGMLIWESPKGVRVGLSNAIGRVFMPQLVDCPFVALNTVMEAHADCSITIVDFHAEATSEKVAVGWHLRGRASLVVGTHTHVQTADERILPGGTAVIADIGMCGPRDSVIGVNHESVVQRFMDGMPSKFDVATGPAIVCGVVCDIDESSGEAQSIERLYMEV